MHKVNKFALFISLNLHKLIKLSVPNTNNVHEQEPCFFSAGIQVLHLIVF